ncbi:MAG: RluA family pseudouridine synthase [Phycisphaerales bacterium]|nr:RluA family pseudouridine synthase [Phycisphaerales bacterium]
MTVPEGLAIPPVIYADNRLVVFEKPTGLLSVPGIGPEKADCLVARAQATFPGARIVHRLDRDTSGVIVLARDADAHRELSRQFQDREVNKTYEAVVGGLIAIDEGTINAAIRKDMDNPPRQMIDDELGRPSVTHWSVIEREEDRTRVRLHPVTGRSHQLRLHLLSIGHPVLGDDLYADDHWRAASPRLLLHATLLEITNPATGDAMVFESTTPF